MSLLKLHFGTTGARENVTRGWRNVRKSPKNANRSIIEGIGPALLSAPSRRPSSLPGGGWGFFLDLARNFCALIAGNRTPGGSGETNRPAAHSPRHRCRRRGEEWAGTRLTTGPRYESTIFHARGVKPARAMYRPSKACPGTAGRLPGSSLVPVVWRSGMLGRISPDAKRPKGMGRLRVRVPSGAANKKAGVCAPATTTRIKQGGSSNGYQGR